MDRTHSPSRGRRAVLAGALGAATALAVVAVSPANPAHAAGGTAAARAAGSGSIVYIKGGRVWIAHTNGTAARPFTKHRFNWAWPSEADDGTVVVAGGKARVNRDGSDSDGSSELYRFTPSGRQIGSFTPTWGSYSTPSCPTFAPANVRVSPDAKKIAYGMWECGDFSDTALWTPANSTHLSFPHQDIGQEDYYQPSWVDNSTFLVSHAGPTVTDTQARWFTHKLTQSDDNGVKGWVEPAMGGTGAQGLISRNGDEFAVFEDDAADWTDGKPRSVELWLYTGSNIPDNWTKRCVVTLDAAETSDPLDLSPSFSADGTKLAWGDDRGVEVASVSTPSNCSTINPHLMIPGGSQPFFSAGTEHAGAHHPRQPGSPLRPHGRFVIKTHHARVHHKVHFNARKSSEPGGRIASYKWHFGDGHKGKGRKVTHRYDHAGTYKVTLIVRDRHGHRDKVSHHIKVRR